MSNFTEFGIFMFLLDGKTHTAKEIAEKFEVNTKTIYRQTNKLVYAGYPITTIAGKNGGICIAEKFKCKTWFFSEEELAYIQNIIASSANIDPIKSSIICDKIAQHINSQNFKVANKNLNCFFVDNSNWFSKENCSIATCQQYVSACANHQKIQIQYGPNYEKRIIDPYCIVQKEGFYYLYGFCNIKQDYRLFKIDKIINYKLLQETFEPLPIDLKSKPWNNSKNKIHITIETDQDIAKDISNWTICKNISNNKYIISATNNKGLIHRLMQYGQNIKILSPQKIISDLILECKLITDLYKIL